MFNTTYLSVQNTNKCVSIDLLSVCWPVPICRHRHYKFCFQRRYPCRLALALVSMYTAASSPQPAIRWLSGGIPPLMQKLYQLWLPRIVHWNLELIGKGDYILIQKSANKMSIHIAYHTWNNFKWWGIAYVYFEIYRLVAAYIICLEFYPVRRLVSFVGSSLMMTRYKLT